MQCLQIFYEKLDLDSLMMIGFIIFNKTQYLRLLCFKLELLIQVGRWIELISDDKLIILNVLGVVQHVSLNIFVLHAFLLIMIVLVFEK